MARVTNQSEAGLLGKLQDKVSVKYFDTTYVRKEPPFRKDARAMGLLLNQQRFRAINHIGKQFKGNAPCPNLAGCWGKYHWIPPIF